MQVVTITTSEHTIDNKIIETLYSNRVTSANKVLVNKVSSLMTSFSCQKPLISKIQKPLTSKLLGIHSFIIVLLVSARRVKNWKTTIIVKSVGKVALFTSSFPSSPCPWPNVDQNVNVCTCNCSVIPTLNRGDGGYLAKEKSLFFQD